MKKSITGFPGYKVDERGNVWSYKRKTEHKLKPHTSRFNGYVRVGLMQNGHSCTMTVHRLVAIAFIPNPENKPEVNHDNGIKTCNEVWNLEWATKSENQTHRYASGLYQVSDDARRKMSKAKIGKLPPNTKLNWTSVRTIRWLCKNSNMKLREIGKVFNISTGQAGHIKAGSKWKEKNN